MNFQTNQDSVIWEKRNEGRDFLKQYIKQKARDDLVVERNSRVE